MCTDTPDRRTRARSGNRRKRECHASTLDRPTDQRSPPLSIVHCISPAMSSAARNGRLNASAGRLFPATPEPASGVGQVFNLSLMPSPASKWGLE
jgi:hypothetical protein